MPHLIYGAAWTAFGAVHSLLAANAVKSVLTPVFGPAYRLAYNLFAILCIALVVYVGGEVFAGTERFSLPGRYKALLSILQISGWGLMFFALGRYDLGRLSGLQQLRWAKQGVLESEDEALRTDGLHRYVRHPIYSAAFLILWGAAWTPLGLSTAVWGSLYLLIGAWFEERKLLTLYGQAYADYRARVPAFVPWRGRAF